MLRSYSFSLYSSFVKVIFGLGVLERGVFLIHLAVDGELELGVLVLGGIARGFHDKRVFAFGFHLEGPFGGAGGVEEDFFFAIVVADEVSADAFLTFDLGVRELEFDIIGSLGGHTGQKGGGDEQGRDESFHIGLVWLEQDHQYRIGRNGATA